jgi:hypothetical protein
MQYKVANDLGTNAAALQEADRSMPPWWEMAAGTLTTIIDDESGRRAGEAAGNDPLALWQG